MWWTEGGRTVRQSTNTGDEEEAGQFLEAFAQIREQQNQPDQKTIAAILDGYLDDRRGRVVDHERLVNAAAPIRKHFGWLQCEDFSPRTTRDYPNKRKAAPATMIKELGTLRAALKWAEREKWIERAPAVIMPTKPPKQDRWLTREEADQLVTASRQTPHIYLFVMIARHTGARKGAIEGLTWSRVDFETGLISFPDPKLEGHRKGRAVVPMNSALRPVLETAFKVRTCDHVLEWNGNPAGNIKIAFRKAARRAGLDDVTPHVIRHSVATWMAQAGAPMRKIAKFLGHEDEATTARIYAHHSPKELLDEAEILA